MKTIETTVYSFDELSEQAQQKAIENNFDINTNYEWYDFIYEDAIKIAGLMGIEIDKIYFSGFSSQGDGACFEGNYQYKKGSVKLVKEYAPNDTVLHSIVERLQFEQKRNFYGVLAYVKHSGHYYHEYCTRINVEHNYNNLSLVGDSEECIIDALRDFMHWIYSSLDAEYWALCSDEAIKETLIANGYQFTENQLALSL